METNVEMPDGKVVTVEHEGELTEQNVLDVAKAAGYDVDHKTSDLLRNLAGEGTRIAGAVTGAVKGSKYGVPGAIVGGIGGAALAELPARAITPREESTGESVANILLGGFQPEAKAATLLQRLGRGAVTGAGLAAAHQTTQALIDEGRVPSLAEMAPNMAVGSVVGAPLEGILGSSTTQVAKPVVQPATEEGSITAALDKRKPSSLQQANDQANQIALSKQPEAPAAVVPKPNPQDVIPPEVQTVKPVVSPKVSTPPEPAAFKLPKDLANAKPRYSYGTSQFELQFDDDLDKALYILAQKNPSKRDADYMKAVLDHTGISEGEARKLGATIKDRIKSLASASEDVDGVLSIPSTASELLKPKVAPVPPQPKRISVDDEDAIDAAVSQANPVNPAATNNDLDPAVEAMNIAQTKPLKEWKADYKTYKDLSKQMTEFRPGTDEHNAVWRAFEDVRNKYGGMPVPEPPKGAQRAPKIAPEAPVATETPIVEQNAPSAAKTPVNGIVEPPATPPKETAQGGEGPETKVRKGVRDVLGSEEADKEYKKLLESNPEIQYEVHNQASWKNKAEAATDQELNDLMSEATRPDAKVVYLTEMSNRQIAKGNHDEGQRLFVEAQKLGTPSGQTLRALGLVKSPLTDLAEAESVAAKAGKNLSKEQKAKVMELSSDQIEAQKKLNLAEKKAKEFFTKENIQEYQQAQRDLADAKKSFDDYTNEIAPRDLPDMLSKIVQGNLLTPLSVGSNVFGNILFAPLQRITHAGASAMDAIITAGLKGAAKLTGRDASQMKRSISATNPLPSALELQAMAGGVKTAAKELLTGPGQDSYIKAEVQRGFKPLRSLMDAWSGQNIPLNKKGNVDPWERTKAAIEGTLGVPPETMFRLLAIGDKPFRRAAEARALLEQANLKGIKPEDMEKFMMFPDAHTASIVQSAGQRSVFSEENSGITTLNRFLDNDLAKLLRLDKIPGAAGAVKVFGRLTVPFRQFPINYALSALNYAAPPMAMAKSLYFTMKSHAVLSAEGMTPKARIQASLDLRKKALTNLAEAAMGGMMYVAASILWDKGLISESPADTSAKRSDQSERMGASKLNVSGLDRYLSGGDPAYLKGDKLVDWTRMGIPAVIFHVFTEQAARERDKVEKTGQADNGKTSMMQRLTDTSVGALPGLGSFIFDQSFLAGTNSLMEAIKDADPDSPKFKNWMSNMFKAISAIPMPNTVEAVARAKMEHIPELRGKTMEDTLKHIWDYKVSGLPKAVGDKLSFGNVNDLPMKVDTWGRPLKRTPEGANPFYYGMFDVLKSGRQKADPHDQALYDLYQKTLRPGIYPDPVERSIVFNQRGVELAPEDVEKLQEIVGDLRRKGMEKFVDSAIYNKLKPMERALALEKIYSDANEAGRKKFISSSGIFDKYFSANAKPEITSRSTTAVLSGQ